MRCVTPCSIQFIWEESPAVFKRIIVRQGESGVKVHRSSRWKQDKWAERDSGSSSAGKRAWQYILIDITTPLDRFCRFFGGLALILSADRLGVDSAALRSGVARHLAPFTAVERGVVEEGAAFTVPMGPFKVLVRLGRRRRLGTLLSIWQNQTGALYENRRYSCGEVPNITTTQVSSAEGWD